jgi:hypothetical protein
MIPYYSRRLKWFKSAIKMIKEQSIMCLGWCIYMVVHPWHVGSTGNDNAAQQVQLSEAWPETVILVDG